MTHMNSGFLSEPGCIYLVVFFIPHIVDCETENVSLFLQILGIPKNLPDLQIPDT